jgi:DNA repair protein RecO (recombination protein O)
VSAEGAGLWKEKLLPLPPFLAGGAPGDVRAWADGLRLSSHFLGRDVFGLRHRPLPPPRIMLEDKVWNAARLTDKAAPAR